MPHRSTRSQGSSTQADVLAFLLLHPHPRMNVMITRREAEDLAAYISTLAR